MPRMSPDQVNIADLTRDPDDGAYHCPSCEAPFTRRSNLRRHYVIHTRSLPFKCTTCGDRFSRSDELHYHSLVCSENSWRSAPNTILHSMPNFQQSTNFDLMSTLQNDTPNSSPTTSTSPQLEVPSPTSSIADNDLLFSDFMTSLAIQPNTDLFPSGQLPTFDQLGIDGLSPENSSPNIFPPSRSRLHARKASQPYNGGSRRKKSRDRPIYTRRQVDDMLNAVSNCFAGTMEEVLKRVGPQEKPSEKGHESTKSHDSATAHANGELRKILNETLPRLFTGLQNLLEEKARSD